MAAPDGGVGVALSRDHYIRELLNQSRGRGMTQDSTSRYRVEVKKSGSHFRSAGKLHFIKRQLYLKKKRQRVRKAEEQFVLSEIHSASPEDIKHTFFLVGPGRSDSLLRRVAENDFGFVIDIHLSMPLFRGSKDVGACGAKRMALHQLDEVGTQSLCAVLHGLRKTVCRNKRREFAAE
jgi:hypothetical protein